MLSSRKALEPRSLHGSSTGTILLSKSRTGHRSSFFLFSIHRDFSWGSKHKNTTSRAGTVYKGFDTQNSAGTTVTQKQMSTLFGHHHLHHHLRRYLPSYVPIQESRFSSSWWKKLETPSSSRNKAEANGEEDCYTRGQKQKLRQYNDFVKKVEHDPYTALFGNIWLDFSRENTEPKATRSPSPSPPKESSVPKKERTPEKWPSKSKSSSTKIPENRDFGARQSKSETIPVHEHDQEYEIDPITNRKVLKTSPSPEPTVGHIKSQVTDVEKAFETIHKRWDPVSPGPLDRCFIVVEQAQVLSSPYPLSKEPPLLKPHNRDGWLAQEGFGNVHWHKAGAQPTLQTHDAKPNSWAAKIETALDRHLSRKSTREKGTDDRPRMRYKPEENKTEDVDLLRPSDVRASAGLRGNLPKETDVDKQVRRQKLERNFESCSPDSANQLAGEIASDKLAQKREDSTSERSTAADLHSGGWLKGTPHDAKIRNKEASKGTPAARVNELSDVRDFDPVPIDEELDSTLVSKNESTTEPPNAVTPEAQVEARGKASKLKAQIVPFKAKLDAMKAYYDSLREQWLQELQRVKEKAAEEEEAKAQKVAKRVSQIHEEEIANQKVAMEAMEMRSNDGNPNTAKTSLDKGIGKDDGHKPAPRRLQSFLQGEGDMASNVHEFAGRDRWYKRKAPHAMDAKDVEMDAKLQKLATDRALIREIRGIYEDTYGTIDTKHRQPHVPSIPLTKQSGYPTTSSSGRVALHAQLPSSAAGITGSLRDLDKPQSTDALEIVQKLFDQLREVQSIIQDYRSQTKQALGASDKNTNMFRTLSAFENSVMQIAKTSGQLARVRPGDMMAQDSVAVIAAANSKESTINRPLSTTAPKATSLKAQKATKLNTYCILAYDSATQMVKSAEATTLALFSKEESLLPLDALNRSSNPGKFLPHVMSLGDKGYEPVFGTSNILVFKKAINPHELAETKKTDTLKELNPLRNLLDHLPVVPDNSTGDCVGNWPFNPITEEDIEKYRQTQLDEIEAEQQKVKETQKQAVEKINEEQQKVEEVRKTAMDGIKKEKQPCEGAQKQQFASSISPSHTPSDKVHRQETVFSGSRHGRWVDNNVKHKKSKRAAGRRRKTIMKSMLMAGALTAASCYCVGVASEMLHGW